MASIYLSRKSLKTELNILLGLTLQSCLLLIVWLLVEEDPVATLNPTPLSSPHPVFEYMAIYTLIFLACCSLFFPDRNSRIVIISGILVAIIIRLLLLNVHPKISSDYHRNLMFGNIWVQGVDPYTTTGGEILQLIQNGEIELIVPYTSAWNTHAFDYPSAAIWLFWFIIHLTLLFPSIGDAFIWGKVVLNVFDLGCGYVVYRITRDRLEWHNVAAQRTAVLFLLNPFSIFLVGLEGQFEVFSLFTFLVALYFFLGISLSQRDSITNRLYVYLGTFFFILSILAKYYSLVALPGIIWLMRDRRLLLRFIGAIIVFGFYLSIPFIVTGPYIINFLNFQAERNANPLTNIYPVLLGYEIDLSFSAYLLCGLVILFAILKGQEEELNLGVMAFCLTLFLFVGNSFYPWYFLWLLNVYPLIRSIDSYTETLFWFVPSFIFLVVWLPENSILWLFSIIIVVIGAIVTYKPFQ